MEAGTLIVDRTRVPYVVGCVLPSDVIRQQIVKSQLHVHSQNGSLELNVQFDPDGQQHRLHVQLDAVSHRDFLQDLADASALYLLIGSDHPNLRTICNRINQGGVAVEINELLRNQVLA
ncbi:hypothetical protein EV586_105229 [Tumebacillus sp. BK434]|uniref:hypothetical protein n=1 Tax=Tumebacillus sp. BK434 TaxID=2512169 RepID=UPI00104474A6|nr:hypothetical protein [Tumebacillus sp. BK434]TCP53883.1 hypothetical protein EV586_105229 [Tumebacillus sp. BK434]